LVGTGLHHCSA